jgi:hypothetical protein
LAPSSVNPRSFTKLNINSNFSISFAENLRVPLWFFFGRMIWNSFYQKRIKEGFTSKASATSPML